MVSYCICKILLVRVILFDLAFRGWYRCLVGVMEILGVIVFDLGTEDGPSVHMSRWNELRSSSMASFFCRSASRSGGEAFWDGAGGSAQPCVSAVPRA